MSHTNHNGASEYPSEESSSRPARRPGTLFLLPTPRPYASIWALQQRLHAERMADLRPDLLLLLEHEPVYTMGRTTQPAHWHGDDQLLQQLGATLQPVDRGGSITYHGPGQLIGYPIIKLSGLCSGPRAYVQMLEQVLIDALALFGITGYRVAKKPGVWAHIDGTNAKLASIGVRLERGVTMHGFALNVDLDLAPFSYIVPCGLDRCRITSMAELLQKPAVLSLVSQQIARCFADTFNFTWNRLPLGTEQVAEIDCLLVPQTFSTV